MAWHRKGGRLVRRGLRTDVTPSELPRRRRRRARPKPRHRHHLGSLPDDIAKRMFAFVAPPADPVPFLRILATDSAVRGLVNRCCLEHLNTCAVDAADGVLLMRAFARARAPLRSLTVHLGSDEVPMLRWLLETCDTTNLSRVRVVVSKSVPEMLLLAHARSRESGVVDIDADAFEVPTMDDFRRIVAWTPNPGPLALSNLRSLRLVSCVGKVLHQLGDVFENLDELELTVPKDRNRVVELTVLSRMPRLRLLALRGGVDTCVALESSTVQVINTIHADKALFIVRANCPALRRLHVRDFAFGNGARRTYRPPPEKLQQLGLEPDAVEAIKMAEDRPAPPHLQSELDRLDPRSPTDNRRYHTLKRQIEDYCRSLVVKVPVAGNTWVVPNTTRNFNMISLSKPASLPETCTVHFHSGYRDY